MTADLPSSSAVPVAAAGDPDDVVWALETSAVEWGRGSYADSIAWIRRAAEAAIEREAWGRARELNAVATELARKVGQAPSQRPAATGASNARAGSNAGGSAVDDLLALPTTAPASLSRAVFRAPEASTSVEFVEVDADEIEAELVESSATHDDDGLEALESHEEIQVTSEIEPEFELELDTELESDRDPAAFVQAEEAWDDLTVRADDALSSSPEAGDFEAADFGAADFEAGDFEAADFEVAELGDADVESLIENPLPREERAVPKSPPGPARTTRVLRAKDDYLDSDAELEVSPRLSAPPSSRRAPLSTRGGRPPPPPPEMSQILVPPPSAPGTKEEALAPSSRSAAGAPDPFDLSVSTLASDKGISERLAQALRTHELSQRRRSSKPPSSAEAQRGSAAPHAPKGPSTRPSTSERPGSRESTRAAARGSALPSAVPEEPVIYGIALHGVEGLEDLPVEAQHKLTASVQVTELSAGEVVGDFAVALVLGGAVEVRPADAPVTAAEVRRAEVVITRGSLDEPFALRMVAGSQGATLGLWDVRALDDATRDCPWVADALRVVADRHRALAGLCAGDLGTRLDLGLRKMVFEKFEVRYVLPGELLCQQGERLTGMYVVGAGGIEIVVGTGADARVSRVLGSGDVLFARQVLGAGSAPASARGAPSGALVLFAARPVAHELMLSVPPLLEILAG